jgi:porin
VTPDSYCASETYDVSGWSVQPNIQYVIRPGGGVADPSNPSRALRNAAIFGLRTSLKF